MPLPIPNLDDRRFQDIVDEAKRLIPRYCPEWTDHNVSDPGVTLIELFAWMTEMQIYRINRLPEKAHITFLELMGVQLQPPTAARTPLTFWLSAPAIEPVVIPAGAEVATVQTASDPAVSFHTDAELIIRPPELVACLTSPDEREFTDQTWRLSLDDERFPAFQADPQPGNSFYLGYTNDLSNTILSLRIDCSIEGIGVDPKNPPLEWEAWCHDGWAEAEIERDETGGLNKQGQIVLYLPPRLARIEINGTLAHWIRCRYTMAQPGQPDYSASPRIQSIRSETIGGMVSATHASRISGELLGRSDGKPGQSFRLEHAPVLRLAPGETAELQREDGSWESWAAREHFGDSGPQDRHFVLDNVSGELRFGPSIREPDGSERQYGAIPSRGSLVRFSSYRRGGGAAGNVGTRTLTVLKSSIPYVDRVSNRLMVNGGRDAETLEHAKLAAPRILRTRFRAVTAEDYEVLACEASMDVARARCLQPQVFDAANGLPPGSVRVVLVPSAPNPQARLSLEELQPSQELIRDVRRYLDQRRMLTTTVHVESPAYVLVRVEAHLRARPEANLSIVRREAISRLERFLNPLVGGNDGNGWPFGHDLYMSEIYTVLQQIPGIAYIEDVKLFADDNSAAQPRIQVPPDGLISSAEHQIVVV